MGDHRQEILNVPNQAMQRIAGGPKMSEPISNVGHSGDVKAAVEDSYDAFLSYSTKDVKFVRRLQRFLQSFRKPTSDGSKRRLRVCLDYTDIRGGDLSAEI